MDLSRNDVMNNFRVKNGSEVESDFDFGEFAVEQIQIAPERDTCADGCNDPSCKDSLLFDAAAVESAVPPLEKCDAATEAAVQEDVSLEPSTAEVCEMSLAAVGDAKPIEPAVEVVKLAEDGPEQFNKWDEVELPKLEKDPRSNLTEVCAAELKSAENADDGDAGNNEDSGDRDHDGAGPFDHDGRHP